MAMKQVTGEWLNNFTKEEEKIWKILVANGMGDILISRDISYQWSNTFKAAGRCHLTKYRAVVQISRNFRENTYVNTVRHEILHAFFPLRERHGDHFMTALNVLNEAGIKVSRFASSNDWKKSPYKYIIHSSRGGKWGYMRKTSEIQSYIKEGCTCEERGWISKKTQIKYWLEIIG